MPACPPSQQVPALSPALDLTLFSPCASDSPTIPAPMIRTGRCILQRSRSLSSTGTLTDLSLYNAQQRCDQVASTPTRKWLSQRLRALDAKWPCMPAGALGRRIQGVRATSRSLLRCDGDLTHSAQIAQIRWQWCCGCRCLVVPISRPTRPSFLQPSENLRVPTAGPLPPTTRLTSFTRPSARTMTSQQVRMSAIDHCWQLPDDTYPPGFQQTAALTAIRDGAERRQT